VSDVDGIRIAGTTLLSLSAANVDDYRSDLGGGILPKLEAALRAARAGIRVQIGKTHILA
jgi:acetylglutamate kinase